MESSLRLSSSRICQVLNDMDILRRVFNKQMLLRLVQWCLYCPVYIVTL